jgi:hypothetical protein
MITTAPAYVKRIRRNMQGYSYKGIARWRLRDRSDRCDIVIKRLLIKHSYTLFYNDKGELKTFKEDWESYPKGLKQLGIKI